MGRIAARWEPDLFASRWANLIVQWCVKHFKKYDKEPGRHIQSIFEHWANAKSRDAETVELVERFLGQLSKQYTAQSDEINPQFVIDLAGQYFNTVKTKRLIDQMQNDLENEDLESALAKHNKFSRVEMGVGAGIEVFNDREVIKGMIEDKRKPLIKYPGALGHFFYDALERDAFVAIQAPEKRGKSFWLQDLSFRAMKQGCKVAYFECGDMSLNQVMRRFITRIMRRPLKATRHPFRFPTEIEHDPDSPEAEAQYDTREYKDDVDLETIMDITKQLGDSKSLLRLSCHSNSTLSLSGINSILQGWEHDDWQPDVIVIDYVDIMDMRSGRAEGRDQINDTWKALRALNQRLHCLLITATQAKASSYSAHTQDQSHFSDDKRKHGHVTAMFAINQTSSEKEKGISRLNWVDLRDSEFDTSKLVYVAECRSISNIAVRSCF